MQSDDIARLLALSAPAGVAPAPETGASPAVEPAAEREPEREPELEQEPASGREPEPGPESGPELEPARRRPSRKARARAERAEAMARALEDFPVERIAGSIWVGATGALLNVCNAAPLTGEEQETQVALAGAYARARLPDTGTPPPEVLLLAAVALLVAPRAPAVTRASGRGLSRLWAWWRGVPAPAPATDGPRLERAG